MTLAIMQPYFFPYIGYWQLIDAVDVFVIYDDVNYIKKGYINRNIILNQGKPHYFTLELIGASQNKLIKEIEVGNNITKLQKTLTQNYAKAPYFTQVFPLFERILNNKERNLAKFLAFSIEQVSNYIGIDTKFIFSSDIKKNRGLKGEEKILAIAKELGAENYMNAAGGKKLYNKKTFSKEGIELKFIESEIIDYRQFHDDFVPCLSIIDILMFNSKEEIQRMIQRYTCI